MGGRSSNSTYQYALTSDNSADLQGMGRQAGRGDEGARRRADRRRFRPAGERRRDPGHHRPRQRLAHGDHARAPSTTRSTTPSASGRSRRSTRNVNQYAVILEWRRGVRQGPEALNDVYVPTKSTSSTTSHRDHVQHAEVNPGACATPRRRFGPEHLGHRHGAPAHVHASVAQERHPDLDQPPERRAGDDGLVQPGRRQDPGRRPRGVPRPRPRSACRPACAAASRARPSRPPERATSGPC
ncbi:hypothetical protein ACRAWD_21320 [Caulobacter segnis]